MGRGVRGAACSTELSRVHTADLECIMFKPWLQGGNKLRWLLSGASNPPLLSMIPIDNRFEAAALWVLVSDSVTAHESPQGCTQSSGKCCKNNGQIAVTCCCCPFCSYIFNSLSGRTESILRRPLTSSLAAHCSGMAKMEPVSGVTTSARAIIQHIAGCSPRCRRLLTVIRTTFKT